MRNSRREGEGGEGEEGQKRFDADIDGYIMQLYCETLPLFLFLLFDPSCICAHQPQCSRDSALLTTEENKKKIEILTKRNKKKIAVANYEEQKTSHAL